MGLFPILLIGLPVLAAVLIPLIRQDRTRDLMVYGCAGGVMILTLVFLFVWLQGGADAWYLYADTELANHGMLALEVCLMCLILFLSFRYRRLFPAILSIAQTALLFYTESAVHMPAAEHMMADRLAMLMCVIIAFVGGFICIYAVGYMKGYHAHHKEFASAMTITAAI